MPKIGFYDCLLILAAIVLIGLSIAKVLPAIVIFFASIAYGAALDRRFGIVEWIIQTWKEQFK